MADTWANAASYEGYVGRWSRLVAREFLAWLAVPAGRSWLDLGCGSGALSETIAEHAAPKQLDGIDASPEYIAFARQRLTGPQFNFTVADVCQLPCLTQSIDAIVSGLVLNFVAEPERAVAEMARVVRPGGTVAAYVWDYAGRMELMRHFWDAAVALDPGALRLDEGRRFPICNAEPLRQLFHAAGLTAIEVKAIDVSTVFRDFDDYWTPFLGGQAPAPGYCVSLDEIKRRALREEIRRHLPIEEDGSIRLIARAWAARAAR